jgi:hypothetical protein
MRTYECLKFAFETPLVLAADGGNWITHFENPNLAECPTSLLKIQTRPELPKMQKKRS